MISTAPFIHLHNHSSFSLLRSVLRVPELVRFAAEHDMPAIALTDRGNLFGAVEFYEAAKNAGVKPIFGMEVSVVRDRRAEDPAKRGPAHSLVLLAADENGWNHLMKLSSLGWREGLHDGAPHVDDELLADHARGILALSGGGDGVVTAPLRDGDLDTAARVAGRYREIFGPDSFFVEIQDHGLDWEERVRALASELGRREGHRLVATNHAHAVRREQANALDVLWAIRNGTTIDDLDRVRLESPEYHLKASDTMRELFEAYPDAVANTVEIAERCDVDIGTDEYHLPEFPIPDEFPEPIDYLARLSREGAVERYGERTPEIDARLDHELGVIRSMGFAGYFLITSDFVRAARERGIPVGPGRGSAAGSLVCYCIGITDVDPLQHDLLFERFLNPERVSMPDIDIDFCFEQREKVIDYVVETYGKESVCQIITFGKILARGAIKDVGRAMGLGYGETDRIAKMIPDELGITLAGALEKSEELRNLREEDPRYDRLIHTCLELEGTYRHTSIHAAGVLIAPGDLVDYMPLHKTTKDEVTTQWDMVKVEEMGFLKMDFLGLRTLTVIDKALKFLPGLGGPSMSDREIPLDDPAVYEMLGRGETVGVFQLESSGMQEILRKLKPSGFDDVTAVNALYRPGPLGTGMVDDFIDRKHGRKRIEYEHEILEPILEPTYGVILYQEQVMRIAGDMAGYSLGQADQLRRAMGKKKIEVMAEQKVVFVEGAAEKGVQKETAEHVFDLMAYFAGYGFNKSHSAAYAVLAVQTAWLKVHWPAAFMASTMTSEMGTTERVVTLADECRRMGLTVHPPDVNTCTADFRPSSDGVRYGLGAIKNVGLGAIEAIVEARERLGRDFKDLYEFCDEVDPGRLNRRMIEALILAGALDTLPGRREQKVAALDLALARAQRRARDRDRGQTSLFGGDGDDAGLDEATGVLPDVEPWTLRETLARERELIGMYLSAHPLDEERQLLDLLQPFPLGDMGALEPDRMVACVGVVTFRRVVTSRKTGRLIAFVGMEDLSGRAETVVFSDSYETHRQRIASDEPLVFVLRTSRREGEDSNRIGLEDLLTLDEALARLVRSITLRVDADVDAARVERVLGAVAAAPGDTPITLSVRDTASDTIEVRAGRGVTPGTALLHALVDALGESAVALEVMPAARLVPDRPRMRRRPETAATTAA